MQASKDVERQAQNASEDAGHKGLYGASPRIIVMTLVLVVLVSIIQVRGWDARLGPYLDELNAPSTGGLAIVLLMLLANLILRRSKYKFKPHEMVLVYIVVTFIIMTAGMGFVANMANAIMGPWYQALSGVGKGEWESFVDRIPSILMPKDQDVAMGFWMGGADSVPWGPWIVPVIMWTILATAILFLQLCLSNLVREYWTYREHLTYPLTQPILQTFTKTPEHGNVWRNRIALLGIGFSAALSLVNILHSYVPAIPRITLSIDLAKYFTEKPWDAMADWPPQFVFGFSPLHCGIAYILPLNVSFSMWFFALFYKLQNVAMNSLGYYDAHAQDTLWWSWAGLTRAAGAYTAIAIFVLWRARHCIKELVLIAIGRMKADESNAPLSSRLTIFGGIAALAFVLLFMNRLVGVPMYATFGVLFAFSVYSLTIARLRAEAGLPRSHAAPLETGEFAMSLLGPAWINPGVRGIGFLFYLSYGSAPSMSAWMLEGYKMADQVNLKRKSMTRMIFLTYVLTAVMAFGVFLYLAYDYGASMFEQGTVIRAGCENAWTHFDLFTNAHKRGTRTYYFRNTQFINHTIGFLFAVFLSVMNSKYVWWPFHPVGYAWGLNTVMPSIWSYYFVAWVIKTVTIRFGGYETAKKIYPFFIGLIIGNAGMRAIHSLIGIIFPTL